jgi:hypothetical protein
MKFQIPQFIDVEDKIFGPLTLKQFIYLAGGIAATIAGVTLLGTFLGFLFSSPILLLAFALAFYKVNNRPFINVMESAFKYVAKDKLYIWRKKEIKEKTKKSSAPNRYTPLNVPHLTGTKLKDMNWELDVKKKEDELINSSQ